MSNSETIDNSTQELLAPLIEGEASDDHEVWMKSEIKKTLAKKAAGKMSYHSLDDVKDELGLNAR